LRCVSTPTPLQPSRRASNSLSLRVAKRSPSSSAQRRCCSWSKTSPFQTSQSSRPAPPLIGCEPPSGSITASRRCSRPKWGPIRQDLKDGPLAAGDIAARFEISGPSISRHLSVLAAAGLVTSQRDANRIVYSLVPERLAHALGDFLSAVCPTQVRERRRRQEK